MDTKIKGRARLLGAEINTDINCSSKYLPGKDNAYIAQCDIAGISDGDEIAIDLALGKVVVAARDINRTVAVLPPAVQRILAEGGLIAFLQKHPDWSLA